MKKIEFAFFTEYYQFYILDAETTAQTDSDDFWNEEAEYYRLAIEEGLLGVTTATYGEISGDFRFLDEEPALDDSADHIVEASLNLASGKLEVKNCTSFETKFTFDLDKGEYRVRVSSFNLDTANDELQQDKYVVDIWKSAFSAPKLIKEYIEVY